MAMEITQVVNGSNSRNAVQEVSAAIDRQLTNARQKAVEDRQELTRDQIQRYTKELRRVTSAFNKRLSFNYVEELDLMVVKVIDRDTDTVVKELPPSELQRVHMRIRDAIGLLLDESV